MATPQDNSSNDSPPRTESSQPTPATSCSDGCSWLFGIVIAGFLSITAIREAKDQFTTDPVEATIKLFFGITIAFGLVTLVVACTRVHALWIRWASETQRKYAKPVTATIFITLILILALLVTLQQTNSDGFDIEKAEPEFLPEQSSALGIKKEPPQSKAAIKFTVTNKSMYRYSLYCSDDSATMRSRGLVHAVISTEDDLIAILTDGIAFYQANTYLGEGGDLTWVGSQPRYVAFGRQESTTFTATNFKSSDGTPIEPSMQDAKYRAIIRVGHNRIRKQIPAPGNDIFAADVRFSQPKVGHGKK